jgi:hypothetical protein
VTEPTPYRVADHGAFLATREAGRRAREAVEALLLTAAASVTLDFTGVEAITGGFADEFVAKLIGTYGGRVYVRNANDDVWQTITRALERRGVQTGERR